MTIESKKHYPIRRVKRNDRAESEVPARERGRAYSGNPRPGEPEAFLPRRERRALSHVGGEVQFQGGRDEEHEILLAALDVSAEEEDVMADVHGFHSYPARLHPKTARGLIEGLSKPGDRVLDPFCGSGTVVVEARALGREGIGSDLNPLAVELSWLKSRGPTQKLVLEMVESAQAIAQVAEDRRMAKADPYRRYSDDDRERYPVHILLELDSLAHGIGMLSNTEVTRMLRLVISSMLTKLSHSEGDTTRQRAPRRLRSGFAIELFVKKAEELGNRLDAYRARLPERPIRAYVGCSDARDLEKVESDSVDLIITSPPYPGVYDYLDHHLHRIEWLGLHASGLREGEIGARREYRRLSVEAAADLWRSEIGPTLYELRRTLKPDGRGVMIIADSVVERHPIRADEQIRKVAEKAGIDITCIASQERPLFLYGADQAFAHKARMEHVLIFRPKAQKNRQDRMADNEIREVTQELEGRQRPERFRKFDEERQKVSGGKSGERGASREPDRGGFRPREGASDRGGFRPREGAPERGGFRPREGAPERGGFRPREGAPERGGFRPREGASDRGGFRPREGVAQRGPARKPPRDRENDD